MTLLIDGNAAAEVDRVLVVAVPNSSPQVARHNVYPMAQDLAYTIGVWAARQQWEAPPN